MHYLLLTSYIYKFIPYSQFKFYIDNLFILIKYIENMMKLKDV